MDPNGIGIGQVTPLLQSFAGLGERLVLVGGQAVNYWEAIYEARVPALAASAPYASMDIDFCADRRTARECAAKITGRLRLPDMDHATISTGLIQWPQENGDTWTIDFISAPFGLDEEEVRRTSIPFSVPGIGNSEGEYLFHVMHPVLVMESRVHNTMGLAAYRNDHALKQLRASVECAREFLIDLLDAGQVRAVLTLNERIFRFRAKDVHGKAVAAAYGPDPFDAVLVNPRLPENFLKVRYPQMRRQLGL